MRWLLANDPLYTERNELDYPYLTARQISRRREKEIPESCLRMKKMMNRYNISEEEAERVKEFFQ